MLNLMNLTNLGNGAAVEKFNEALDRVIENIQDPNTEATSKREIVLRVVIRPNAKRDFGAIQVYAAPKLAPPMAFGTMAHFGMDKGKPVAYENRAQQLTFDEIQNPAPDNVVPVCTKKEAAK
jgi:hypothetical protein